MNAGVQALPIISVTSMLFGLILAFVGAVQLTQFGAQIYVAGLVGIGMLRVMGAVMVGVVMSGRGGCGLRRPYRHHAGQRRGGRPGDSGHLARGLSGAARAYWRSRPWCPC